MNYCNEKETVIEDTITVEQDTEGNIKITETTIEYSCGPGFDIVLLDSESDMGA